MLVRTVGWKNVPPRSCRVPPVTITAPRDGVAHQAGYFLHGGLVDQRTNGDARLQAIAHAQIAHGGGVARGKGVVDAVLHENAVGADAGLTGIAVFGGDGAVDGFVQVGVVEYNEGRVAAQL